MKFFKMFFIVSCTLAVTSFLSAQSTAAEIETLLETKAVTYEQAARFILQAADVKITNDPEEAFNHAIENNWLPRNVASNDPARLDRISLLLMRSFDINGGLFYSIFKNSHYAYRELVYKNIIQGRHTPTMPVSGERLLFFVNRIFSIQEALAAGRRVEITMLEE
jgi:hypothetical protein